MELRIGQENLLNGEPRHPASLSSLVKEGIEVRIDRLEGGKEFEDNVCGDVPTQNLQEWQLVACEGLWPGR